MVERQFSFQDLLSVLLNGEVKDQPEYDSTRSIQVPGRGQQH
ncbi:hypothetical protein [Desulforhabdus amnigena]